MFYTRKLLLTLAASLLLGAAPSWSQPAASQDPKPGHVEFPHYKDNPAGRVLDAIFTGWGAVPFPAGGVQVQQFKMIGVRDGQITNITFTAQAPECRIDYDRKIAGDPGPIQIYTPVTNLFVQGVGFFCADSNQLLLISNQVETRVVKSMFRSSPLFAGASNTPDDLAQIVKIFSDRGQFSFPSNLVDYAGNVRLIDPQYEVDSPLLSIQLASNQTVQTMFAAPPLPSPSPARESPPARPPITSPATKTRFWTWPANRAPTPAGKTACRKPPPQNSPTIPTAMFCPPMIMSASAGPTNPPTPPCQPSNSSPPIMRSSR